MDSNQSGTNQLERRPGGRVAPSEVGHTTSDWLRSRSRHGLLAQVARWLTPDTIGKKRGWKVPAARESIKSYSKNMSGDDIKKVV